MTLLKMTLLLMTLHIMTLLIWLYLNYNTYNTLYGWHYSKLFYLQITLLIANKKHICNVAVFNDTFYINLKILFFTISDIIFTNNDHLDSIKLHTSLHTNSAILKIIAFNVQNLH